MMNFLCRDQNTDNWDSQTSNNIARTINIVEGVLIQKLLNIHFMHETYIYTYIVLLNILNWSYTYIIIASANMEGL